MTAEPNPEHSILGASSAERWLACPGSVQLAAECPTPPTSAAAEQGTAAHWVLEQCLTSDRLPEHFYGSQAPNEVDPGDDDIDAVRVAYDFIQEQMKDGKWILYAEGGISLPQLDEDLWGTADVILVSSDMKKLKVYDYKNGTRPVEVKNNKQLMYYGLGGIAKMDEQEDLGLDMLGWGQVFDEVEIGVLQPQCKHKDGPCRTWVVPPERLDSFAVELTEGAETTRGKMPMLNPGPHCTYCGGMPKCGAILKDTQAVAKRDFAKPTSESLPDIRKMTTDQLIKVLEVADTFTEWLASAKNYAEHLMLEGREIPGYKLVKRIKHRKWHDEDDAAKQLLEKLDDDEVFKKKLKTPKQIEALLGKSKELVETLAFKPDGGLQMAPESDRRNAVESTDAKDDFERI